MLIVPARRRRRLRDRIAVIASRDAQVLAVYSAGSFIAAAAERNLLPAPVSGGTDLRFGELFAVVAITLHLLRLDAAAVRLTAFELGVLVLAATSWLAGEQHAVFCGLTIAGFGLMLSRRRRRCIALVPLTRLWLAISVYELWGKLVFKLLSVRIIALETRLIAASAGLVLPSVTSSGTEIRVGTGPWFIYIREGCSSFHNISLAVLIWLSVLTIGRHAPDRAALRALGVSLLSVVAINVVRIVLMLPSREQFAFWHDGVGSTLVAVATVLACSLPVVIGMPPRSHGAAAP